MENAEITSLKFVDNKFELNLTLLFAGAFDRLLLCYNESATQLIDPQTILLPEICLDLAKFGSSTYLVQFDSDDLEYGTGYDFQVETVGCGGNCFGHSNIWKNAYTRILLIYDFFYCNNQTKINLF